MSAEQCECDIEIAPKVRRKLPEIRERLQAELPCDRVRPSVIEDTASWWVWLCFAARHVSTQRFSGRTAKDLDRYFRDVLEEHPYLTDDRMLPLIPTPDGVSLLRELINQSR